MTAATQMQRHHAVNNALVSVRMEGLEPSDDAKAIFQRFAEGKSTLLQMDADFDAHLNRLYGSVPLTRNAYSE